MPSGKRKFHGDFDQLKAHVDAAGIDGDWSEVDGRYVLRTPDRGVLNWWPSTLTVQFQGPADAKARLEKAFWANAPR